jgi:hypothetical protein
MSPLGAMMSVSVSQVTFPSRLEPTMSNEIELIRDRDGVAKIGATSDVEHFHSFEAFVASRGL